MWMKRLTALFLFPQETKVKVVLVGGQYKFKI